jgi:predicted Rossmann fold flavoprotein
MPTFPSMLPLYTEETWVKNCRSDTVGRAEIRIDIDRYHKLHAVGDLIFTENGIAGPVVLDFSREITPLLAELKRVPIRINLVRGMNENEVQQKIASLSSANGQSSMLEIVKILVSEPLAVELCRLSGIDPEQKPGRVSGANREKLVKFLCRMPLTVIGHGGYAVAMVTRGGVCLKEINPATLESRLVQGLFFCGEIVDLDGPCGGFNLQWAFSSGFLAGQD